MGPVLGTLAHSDIHRIPDVKHMILRHMTGMRTFGPSRSRFACTPALPEIYRI
jgi:hypothetical protein